MLDENIKSVLNIVHEGILCFQGHKLVYANPFIQHLLQYTEEELSTDGALFKQGDENYKTFWDCVGRAQNHELQNFRV